MAKDCNLDVDTGMTMLRIKRQPAPPFQERRSEMHSLCAGAAITTLIGDDRAFKTSVEGRFACLDDDGDGLISFSEMARELMSLRMLGAWFDLDGVGLGHPELVELHRDIFSGFDRDAGRAVGVAEFGEEMKEMLAAVAGRIGASKEEGFLYAKL